MNYPLIILFGFLFFACSSKVKPVVEPKESYRSCVDRQENLRQKLYNEMPEKFKNSFAGYHHIMKYYSSSPSIVQLKNDVKLLEKENNTFDYRKDPNSKYFDPRFIDDAPERNRILVSFEKHRHYRFGNTPEVLLLRFDYSKPEVTYTCPISQFKDNKTSLTCQLKGSISSSKQLEGSMLTFNYDFKMRLVPINEKYFYFEWVSSGDKIDQDQSQDQLALRVLVLAENEDRFYKMEFPYLDPQGDLNPEECAALEGL